MRGSLVNTALKSKAIWLSLIKINQKFTKQIITRTSEFENVSISSPAIYWKLAGTVRWSSFGSYPSRYDGDSYRNQHPLGYHCYRGTVAGTRRYLELLLKHRPRSFPHVSLLRATKDKGFLDQTGNWALSDGQKSRLSFEAQLISLKVSKQSRNVT